MLNIKGSAKILKNSVFKPVNPHEKVEAKSLMSKVQKTLNSEGFP
jgi:hypothetical protein